MKDTLQKLLAYLLSFMMLFSSMPINAIAEGVADLTGGEEVIAPIEEEASEVREAAIDVSAGTQLFANTEIMPLAADSPIKVAAYVVQPGLATSGSNLNNFRYQDFTDDNAASYNQGLRYWLRIKNTSATETITVKVTGTLTVDDGEPSTSGAARLKEASRPSDKWPDGSAAGTAANSGTWPETTAIVEALTLGPGEEVNARSNGDYTVAFADEETHTIVYRVVVEGTYSDGVINESDTRTVEAVGTGFSVTKSYSVNGTKFRTSNDQIMFSSDLVKNIVYKVTINNASNKELSFKYSDTFTVAGTENRTYEELELSASESEDASMNNQGVVTIKAGGTAVLISKNTYTPNPENSNSSSWPASGKTIENSITVTRQDTNVDMTSTITLTVVDEQNQERWFGYSMAIAGADFPGKTDNNRTHDGPKENDYKTDPSIQREEYTVGGQTMIYNGTTSGAGAHKYLHYPAVAIDELVTVTSVEPVVESDSSYKFLVWYDKNADTFYTPSEQLFKDSRAQHTIDALWAHLVATGKTKIYDGIEEKIEVKDLTIEGELNLQKYDIKKVIKQFLGETTYSYVVKNAAGEVVASGPLDSLSDVPGQTNAGVYYYEVTATLTVQGKEPADVTAKATLTILPRPVMIEVNSSTHGRVAGTRWKVSDDPLKGFTGEYKIYTNPSDYFSGGSLKSEILTAVLTKAGLSALPSGISYDTGKVYLAGSDAISNAANLTVTYTDTKTDNPQAPSTNGQEATGVYSATIDDSGITLNPGNANNYAFYIIPGVLTIIEPTWKVEKTATVAVNGRQVSLANGGKVKAGDVITYTMTVTNTGTVDLETNLSDTFTGAVGQLAGFGLDRNQSSQNADYITGTGKVKVPAGGKAVFTATYTVAAADKGETLVNVVSAKDSSDDTNPDHEARFDLVVADPALTVTKEITSTKSVYDLGDVISYKITVENTGDVTISDIVVTDDITNDTWAYDSWNTTASGGNWKTGQNSTSGTLEPGETVEFTTSYTVTESDLGESTTANGSVTNTAHAAGKYKDPYGGSDENVEDSDDETATTEVQRPGLDVDKSAEITECDHTDRTQGVAHLGDVITYTLTVSNTGNVTLTNVTLDDSLEGIEVDMTGADWPEGVTYRDGTFTITELAPNDEIVITYTYTVQESDLSDDESNPNKIINIVTNSINDDEDKTETETEEKDPKWAVTKVVAVGENPADDDFDHEQTAEVGDTLTYKITVTNTGNVTLEKLYLLDVFSGDESALSAISASISPANGGSYSEMTIENFKPGAVATLTYTYTVQANETQVDNTVYVDDEEPDPDEPDPDIPHDDTVTEIEEKPDFSVEKALAYVNGDAYVDGESVEVDDVLTYEVTISNTGNTVFATLDVTDSLVDLALADSSVVITAVDANGDTITIESETTGGKLILKNVGIGVVVTISYQYQVTAKDDEIVNTVTVTDGDEEKTDTVETDVEPEPAYTLVKSVAIMRQKADNGEYEEIEGTVAKVGDKLVYTITLTNTGNADIENLKLSDVLTVDELNLSASLTWIEGDPDETFTLPQYGENKANGTVVFKAEYVVQPSDNDISNTAKTDDDHEDTVETTVEEQDAWKVEKSVVVTCPMGDADHPMEDAGDRPAHVGDVVTYTITVTNTGNTKLEDLKLTDEFVVTRAEDETLTLTLIYADGAKQGATYAGEGFDLEQGEAISFTAVYTVTTYDQLLSNTAKAGRDGEEPEESEEVETPVVDTPDIEVIKTVTKIEPVGEDAVEDDPATEENETDGVKVAVGTKVTYTIVVRNAGNVKLTNVRLTDLFEGKNLTITGYTAAIPELAPGESRTYTVTYTITQDDIDASENTNGHKLNNVAAATATYTDSENQPHDITDSDDADVTTNYSRGFTATKKIDDESLYEEGALRTDIPGYRVGDTVEFVIAVTNTGTVTLKNVTVTEQKDVVINAGTGYTATQDQATGLWTATIASIDPGQTVNVKASYTVTEQDIGKTDFKNVATVVDPEQPDDPQTPEEIIPLKAWAVEKTVTAGLVDGIALPGSLLTYEIVITNTGDTVIYEFVLSDQLDGEDFDFPADAEVESTNLFTLAKTGGQWVLSNEDGLEPNDTITITYTYTVPVDTTENEITNAVTVTDGDPDLPSDPPSSTVTKKIGHWTITKALTKVGSVDYNSDVKVKVGETLTYMLTVTNTGETDLLNLVISDKLNDADVDLGLAIWSQDTAMANRYGIRLTGTTLNVLPVGVTLRLVFAYKVKPGDKHLTNVAMASKDRNPDEPDDPDDPTDPDSPHTETSNTVETIVYADIVVTKVWKDGDGVMSEELIAALSEELTALLYKSVNGGAPDKIDEKALNAAGRWKATFADQPLSNADGSETYTYTVEEKNAAENDSGDLEITVGDHVFAVEVTKGQNADGSTNEYTITITNTLQDDEDGPYEPVKSAKALEPDGETATSDGKVQIGDRIEYTITRTSHLATKAKATFTDTLPDGVQYIGNSTTVKVNGTAVTVTSTTAPTDGSLAYNIVVNGQTITWTIFNVPPMADMEIAFLTEVVKAAINDDEIVNTASGDFNDNPATDLETNEVVVEVKQPVLAIEKVADVVAAKPGSDITYTLKVTNSGEGKATGVVVVDTLPAEVVLKEDSFAPSTSTVETDTQIVDGKEVTVITWTIGEIAANAAATLSFTVTLKPTEEDEAEFLLDGDEPVKSVRNVARITDGMPKDEDGNPIDPDPEDGKDPYTDDETTDVADISIEKVATDDQGEVIEDSDYDDRYDPDDLITYTLTVENIGGASLTNVVITDAKFASAVRDENGKVIFTATGIDVEALAYDDDLTTITISTLAAGAKIFISYQYKVTTEDLLNSDKLHNTATVKGQYDPDGPDGELPPTDTNEHDDTVDMPADPRPALAIDKSVEGMTGMDEDGKPYAVIGDELTYTITITNEGNVGLDHVLVTDDMFDREKAENITLVNDGEEADITWEDGALVIGRLEYQAVAVITYTYLVTEDDILLGVIPNTATAVADDPRETSSKEGSYDPLEPVEDSEEVVTDKLHSELVITKEEDSTPEDPGYEEGDTITFRITVWNDGNVTREHIEISEDLHGARFVAGEGYQVKDGDDTVAIIDMMAPDEKVTLYAEYVVTQADLINRSVWNVVLANEPGATPTPNPDNPNPPTATPTLAPDETPTPVPTANAKVTPALPHGDLVVDKQAIGVLNKETGEYEKKADGYELGDVIRYAIIVWNEGNVDVYDVVLTDVLEGAYFVEGSGYSLNKDGNAVIPMLERHGSKAAMSVTVYAEYKVTEADILAGSVHNEATANGTAATPEPGDGTPDPDATPVPTVPVTPGDDDDDNDTESKNSHLTVEKEITSTPADSEGYALGETITYAITVTNDGNLTLTDVVVTDELTGDEWTVETLAPGESKSFTTSYVVTEADVLAGNVLNVVTAKGKSEDPENPEVPADPDEVETETEKKNPHLTVEKEITSTPADSEGYALSETITYAITVTNDGNLTLTDVVVTDELTGDEWTIETLAPGESKSFTTSYVVTEADVLAGTVLNVVTAKGKSEDPENPEVPADPDEVETETESKNPHLTVEKKITSTPADSEGYALGETITYAITVTNDGNLTLTDVVVTDELTGDEWTVETLAPGESKSFTTSYVVTEADILAGTVLNVATAKGKSQDPEKPDVPAEPSEVEVPTEPSNPHLTVTKRAVNVPASGKYLLGEKIVYAITVTNDGNLTLTDVVVTDELTGDRWTVETLAPGESESFKASYVVTKADVEAGSVLNVATAKGKSSDPEHPDVPAKPGTTENQTGKSSGGTPTYELTKKATNIPARGYYLLGEQVEFTVKVKNTGNVEIISFVLTDHLEGTKVVPGAGYSVKSEREALITRMAPGQSVDVHLTYTITEMDVKRGSVRNVATGAGASPDGQTAKGNVTEVYVPTDEKVYDIVVHYYNLVDGTQVAPDQRLTGLRPGDSYEFLSPEIEGLWTLTMLVAGTMPTHNMEITVFYVSDGIRIEGETEDGLITQTLVWINEYGTPLSVGGSTRNVGDCFE